MKPRLFKTQSGLDAFIASRGGGESYHVLIMHDAACSPNHCTCEPWFEVRDLTADHYLDGEIKQRQWVKGSSS